MKTSLKAAWEFFLTDQSDLFNCLRHMALGVFVMAGGLLFHRFVSSDPLWLAWAAMALWFGSREKRDQEIHEGWAYRALGVRGWNPLKWNRADFLYPVAAMAALVFVWKSMAPMMGVS